jgi:short subunit dehydrogenase
MMPGDRPRRFADGALEVSVIGSSSRVGCAARRVLFDWDAEPAADLTGELVVITAATGFVAAHAFAARDADVWLVGRDSARTETSRRQILAALPGAQVTTAIADLARRDDVREPADAVRSACKRLGVLVHNAGALTHELVRTEDGLLRSPEQGAGTIVWLASALQAVEFNGGFRLDGSRRLTNPPPWTRTSPRAPCEVWDRCGSHAHVEADLGRAT